MATCLCHSRQQQPELLWEVLATLSSPWMLPQVRGVKEPSFQSHFRHRGCDSIIPAAFPSVGHSPSFNGLARKLLRPSSLGHFLWKTKWLLRDNEGPVMAIGASGSHRKTPSQTSSKTNQEQGVSQPLKAWQYLQYQFCNVWEWKREGTNKHCCLRASTSA